MIGLRRIWACLTNPSVIAQGRFYRTREDRPDKVQFTNWGNVFYYYEWGYNVRPGQRNGDSAVSMIWDEAAIAPNETREYVTYYGLSEFTEDLSLPLALSAYSDNSVVAITYARSVVDHTKITDDELNDAIYSFLGNASLDEVIAYKKKLIELLKINVNANMVCESAGLTSVDDTDKLVELMSSVPVDTALARDFAENRKTTEGARYVNKLLAGN